MRLIRVMRILRIFKLVRHFAGLKALLYTLKQVSIRVLSRFLDQVGHETTCASIENNLFSLNKVTVRLTKIMNNLLEHLKILIFKVIFRHQKLVESFKNNSVNFNFLKMCPIFVMILVSLTMMPF